ncbi:MAG TPA: trypsin-like serine protease [Pseudonocardiaceae bacterium]|jgi:hypothetical protein|nr:trypsin-like serine protease [Pseudonocardiaceae bacterium]
MRKIVQAAVVGGAAVAVGMLPAAGLANAAVTPNPPVTPIVAPVNPTAPVTDPTDPTTVPIKPVLPGQHKPGHGHRKPGRTTPGHQATGHAPRKHAPKKHRTRKHRTSGRTPSGHTGRTGHTGSTGRTGAKGSTSGKGGHAGSGKPHRGAHPGGSQNPRPAKLILGGRNALNAPWAAQIAWDGTGFECTGTVVAPTWVLTAQHCVSPGAMSVQVGSPKLGQGTTVAVADKQVDDKADLALLRLAEPVEVTPVRLADAGPQVGSVNQIYGWGKTSANSGPASQLKMARVKVTDLGCKDAVGGQAICSTGITGSAFNGDSGGPELAGGTEVGVCSTGDPTSRSQQYVSVAANRDWIRQVASV